jgi:hypothetical protein
MMRKFSPVISSNRDKALKGMNESNAVTKKDHPNFEYLLQE